MKKNGWFEVDHRGLAKLLEERGKAIAVVELLQNAWDTAARRVDIYLRLTPGRPVAILEVTDDDPDGFKDLTHAFTLFAESFKKADPEKRGRFNLGEKLVLSLCNWAEVASTTGTYRFTPEKGRTYSRNTTVTGSRFTGELRLTRAEYEECCEKIRSLIPPKGVYTYFDGEALGHREPLATFEANLPTEIADEDGNLRPTRRNTTVTVYEPEVDEIPSVYEMGIPVVETGDKYHINVLQKVPLNFNRDNVTPAYLRTLRVLVLNETHSRLEKEEATETWVREAAGDKRCTDEAVETTIKHRFGDKVASTDPGDPEAGRRLIPEGYTVLSGGHLSKGEWENVRRAGIVKPAGQIMPTPSLNLTMDPDAPPLNIIDREKWTNGMEIVESYAKYLGKKLLGKSVSVVMINNRDLHLRAAYGEMGLVFNVAKLGYKWFDQINDETLALLLHEFGHDICGDHLDDEYHGALCDLGVKLTKLALEEPHFFDDVF